MPITVTFDLPQNVEANDRNRLRVAFRRFGWETIGGTAYRYPPLNPAPGNALNAEDWFNHVIPALMYMRSLIEQRTINVTNFTIDAFSSTGARAGVGPQIQAAQAINFTAYNGGDANAITENRLQTWIAACANALA
jgi:hypothetical protein